MIPHQIITMLKYLFLFSGYVAAAYAIILFFVFVIKMLQKDEYLYKSNWPWDNKETREKLIAFAQSVILYLYAFKIVFRGEEYAGFHVGFIILCIISPILLIVSIIISDISDRISDHLRHTR